MSDKYVVKLTVEELQNLLSDIKLNGGIAYQKNIVTSYNDLKNKPNIITEKDLSDKISDEFERQKQKYVTLDDLKSHTKMLEEKFNGNGESELNETWIIHKAPSSYFKSNIEFVCDGITYSSIEYKKDTRTDIEEEYREDRLYFDTTCIGYSPQDSSSINYKEIYWNGEAHNVIKFTKEKPTGDLLKWLQEGCSIKGPNTFQGLFNYVNNQDNKTLEAAKTYINNTMNNYHGPIANENTLGVVMGGGHGIDIDENGRLYATGDIVSDAEILWSKIIEKPTTLEKINTDPMCQAIINSLPSSSQSGNYADLLNKPDLSKYALKTEISEYTLPTASTSTLGGVKIDNSTIGISNGFIYVKNTNSAIWTKWTAT